MTTSITGFIGSTRWGPVNHPVRIAGYSEFERRFGGLSPTLETGYAVRQYFLNGGREAWVVRVARNPTKRQLRSGLQALNAADRINLLLVPGISAPALLALTAEYSRTRRAFLIVDSPAAAKTPPQMEQAIRALNFPDKRHAAIYFPWIKIVDPLDRRALRVSPPGGTIAGLIARTDASRGVWKVPAGADASLKGVKGLTYALNDAEIGILNPRGINCLRSLPGRGFVAWGARTLAGDDATASEYKYLSVQRTALFIEESVERGTRWAVFEPNDEPLWAQLRQAIASFLHELFRQGAFAGTKPDQACFVKCDRLTTTAADVAAGAVNIVLGFAPLKPAEFIVLKIRQAARRD